jgi:hypothetical protein
MGILAHAPTTDRLVPSGQPRACTMTTWSPWRTRNSMLCADHRSARVEAEAEAQAVGIELFAGPHRQ